MKKIFIPIAVLTLLAACSNKESDKKLNDFAQNDIQMELNFKNFSWTRQPESCIIKDDTIEVTTKPKTDLWQRTYYHFRNDNAPVFQMETEE